MQTMPNDPARRLVEAMLTVPKFDAYNPGTAMKLAKMLKMALDALEEIADSKESDQCGDMALTIEAHDAREALAEINRIVEED